MQIALAVKSVPFDEIVFVQYPVVEDPYDSNRVAPNYDDAEALWAALEANQPLQLTGEASQGDGVIVTSPTAEPDPSGTPTPGATTTPAPTDQPVALPETITGSTAAQETCSNGNVGQ